MVSKKRPSTASSSQSATSGSPRSSSSTLLPLPSPARPPLSPKLSNSIVAHDDKQRSGVVVPKQVMRVPRRVGLVERAHIWVEGTFVYSMLETWEKVLLNSLAVLLLALLYFAVTSYLPEKLQLLAERVHWYIYGTTTDSKI